MSFVCWCSCWWYYRFTTAIAAWLQQARSLPEPPAQTPRKILQPLPEVSVFVLVVLSTTFSSAFTSCTNLLICLTHRLHRR